MLPKGPWCIGSVSVIGGFLVGMYSNSLGVGLGVAVALTIVLGFADLKARKA